MLLVLLPSFFQPQFLWLLHNSRSPCSSFPPEILDLRSFCFLFVGWVREFSLGRSQRWHFQGNLLGSLLSISDLGFVQLFPFNIPRNCFCRIIVASCSRPSPLTCTNSWIKAPSLQIYGPDGAALIARSPMYQLGAPIFHLNERGDVKPRPFSNRAPVTGCQI